MNKTKRNAKALRNEKSIYLNHKFLRFVQYGKTKHFHLSTPFGWTNLQIERVRLNVVRKFLKEGTLSL